MKLSQWVEKLKSWEEERTKREKILLVLVTIFLPLFLFYRFYYQPTEEKIKRYKEEIKTLELEIGKLEGYVKKEKELEAQLQKRKEFLEEIKEILPTDKEVPKLLKNISLKAKEAQLEIINFTPIGEEPKDYYTVIPFEMQVKGYFPNIIKFLNSVETMSRLVALEGIEFAPQEKEEKLLAKCLFITYKWTGEPLAEKKK